MWSTLILLLGLAGILLGANLLVDGASALAKRFNVSNLVIGLTIVAFGTSAPELTVSIYSGMLGQTDMAIGNVVGSNIFNVMVILGLSALIYPIKVESNTVWKEVPFAVLAAVLLLACANDPWLDGSPEAVISRTDGIFFLGFFAIFMYYTVDLLKKQAVNELQNPVRERPLPLSILMVSGGLLLLIFGGRWTVDGAVDIASRLGMSESMIGLTIIAAGTSLPELATSLVAAYKKNSDIAVGNVVGSNIFNIFLILGVSSVINPLGLGAIDNMDLFACLVSSLILQLFVVNLVVTRWEGAIFFLLYCGYLSYIILY